MMERGKSSTATILQLPVEVGSYNFGVTRLEIAEKDAEVPTNLDRALTARPSRTADHRSLTQCSSHRHQDGEVHSHAMLAYSS